MQIAYFDSSALVKRALDEELAEALDQRMDELAQGACELVTSTLGWVEVATAVRRRVAPGDRSLGNLESDALAGVAGYPISYEVISVARRLTVGNLRSLDAIHCATAALLDADRLITYDSRMAAAARTLGMVVESPGTVTA